MCHPECRWACDDPVCLADCTYVAEDPVCTCSNPGRTPQCYVRCPPDQCESENCPTCETICEPSTACGTITCEQTVAAWACRKPTNCAPPQCELVCELPACEYTGTKNPWETKSSNSILFITGAVIIASLILLLLLSR